jgi:hypothetical protein
VLDGMNRHGRHLLLHLRRLQGGPGTSASSETFWDGRGEPAKDGQEYDRIGESPEERSELPRLVYMIEMAQASPFVSLDSKSNTTSSSTFP